MNSLIFLLLVGIHGATAVTHSMTYIVTAVSGLDGFPEHNEVGLVDGQEFVHYDSNLKKIIPKTVWIEKNEGADYWERETQRNINTQQVFKGNIATVMQRFNQTGGVHVYQWMYGCEWDDETGEVDGFRQIGYDGEDFRAWDMKTNTWIAAKQEAFITTNKWNSNKAELEQGKNYLAQICPEWLKKYLDYGRILMLRTELPSVSLLQKTPSSPVSCHATGFFPHRAVMFWRKDGEELHEDVDKGEILPNHDGSFQMSVDLSSVTPEDWGKCECVFQLSGVKEDIVIKLDKSVIKTNEKSSPLIAIIIAAVAVLALVIGAVGFFIYRKKSAKRPPSLKFLPQKLETSSGGSDKSAESLKKPDAWSCSSSGSSTGSGDSYTPLMKDKSDA